MPSCILGLSKELDQYINHKKVIWDLIDKRRVIIRILEEKMYSDKAYEELKKRK